MDSKDSRDQNQVRSREWADLLDQELSYYRRWNKIYNDSKRLSKYNSRNIRRRYNLYARMARLEYDKALSRRVADYNSEIQSLLQRYEKKD